VLSGVALGALVARDESTTASTVPPVTSTVEPLPPDPAPAPVAEPAPEPVRQPKRSRAVGRPFAGRLIGGVQLPAEGPEFVTWDPIFKRSPNRDWRRYGTDRLLETIARVLGEYRALHPGAPRVVIGDLSRPHGGDFGRRYGAPGHASHQNGLDVDVYYPRRDGLERGPRSPGMVDRGLAQDLVNLFVDAGAQFVFVGPHVRLRGPRRVVQPLQLHDDHMHVRIRRRP
jgi:murein endopeptidase